jgi:hypothetical protein
MVDGIKRNSFRGARAQVYTYLATIYTTLGLGRATLGPPGQPRPGLLYGLWGALAPGHLAL